MANAFDRSQYPLIEPDQLVAGDRWMWRRRLSDYPTSLYTLSYEARSHEDVPSQIDITAIADGDYHVVEVASATTAAYAAATYTWVSFITRDSDSERIQHLRGTFTVKPDAANDGTDPRTFAARMVAKLSASLEALSSDAVESYSIGERSVTKRDMPQLRKELRYWQSVRETEIAAERHARGLPSRRKIKAVFS